MDSKITPKAVPANLHWNWELAFVLYCGGMSVSEILSHKQLRGMPESTLVHRITHYGWAKRRQEVATMDKTPLLKERARKLQEKLEEEALTHQDFMLSELRRERRVLEDRARDEKTQLTRLEALDRIDTLTRKLTRMDERQEANPTTMGFAFLVNQSAPQPVKVIEIPAKPTPSAILPLPDDSEHSMGILRSNNAMPDTDETPEMTKMPAPGSLFGAKPL